jgi:hypothetical protein
MKDQGMLVTISNQMPVADMQSLAATRRQLSMYAISSVYIPTQNWVTTSSCWSRFPLQLGYIKSVHHDSVSILFQSKQGAAEEK